MNILKCVIMLLSTVFSGGVIYFLNKKTAYLNEVDGFYLSLSLTFFMSIFMYFLLVYLYMKLK
ncbi:hypothetical protein PPBDW_II1412 [Photobacterium kishitanii]|nr:hypothetical protein PPBDW_II1412 [Photobacterium kishitanii]